MRYNRKILHYFSGKGKFIGTFENTKETGIGEVGALACGDILKLSLKIQHDLITDVKVMVFGCVSAFAASTYLAEILIGTNIHDALKIENQKIVEFLGLPPIKIHCSVLAKEALHKAINNYLIKNNRLHVSQCAHVSEGYFERKENDILINSQNKVGFEIIEDKCFTENKIHESQAQITFTDIAFNKIKHFFKDKKNSSLLLHVVREGCGFLYKYKIINDCDTGSQHCSVNYEVFKIVFFKNQYEYLQNTNIDFIDKDMDSCIVFRKNKNASYCNCGVTFNIS